MKNPLMILTLTIIVIYDVVICYPEPPPSSSSSSSSNYQYNQPIINSYIPSSSSLLPQQNSIYGAPTLATIIHKHVYVHVPPPETEYQSPRKTIQFPPPQKHYKIVFIKAPSGPEPIQPIIPLLQQNEEKTLVYVLVKKPEEQPDLIIPTLAPTQPSKPEVYFIRYKTQKQNNDKPYSNNLSTSSTITTGNSGDYGSSLSSVNMEYGVLN